MSKEQSWFERNAPKAPDARTSKEVMQDQAADVLRGIPQAITGLPVSAKAVIMAALQGNPMERDRQIGELAAGMAQPATAAVKGAISGRTMVLPGLTGSVQFPEFPEGDPSNPAWQQAAEGAGAMLGGSALGNLGGAALEAIPSKVRAAANLERIMGKARNEPINTAAADAIASRYQELKLHGNPSAKVLNDYIRERAASPDMTYETGRDFQTSSGKQSIKQITKQNDIIQAKVGEFSEAMKTANREAAARVGMGELFDAAMKEYRQASSIADKAAILKKWAVPAAATAAASYVGFRAAANLFK